MELCFDVPNYSDVDIEFQRVINAGGEHIWNILMYITNMEKKQVQ